MTQACEAASRKGQASSSFFLLRKKWRSTQRIFEAEAELRLMSDRHANAAS
jgi:hypothetical protein